MLINLVVLTECLKGSYEYKILLEESFSPLI